MFLTAISTRIDDIFEQGPVTFEDYGVLVWKKPNGLFTPKYQPSDQ